MASYRANLIVFLCAAIVVAARRELKQGGGFTGQAGGSIANVAQPNLKGWFFNPVYTGNGNPGQQTGTSVGKGSSAGQGDPILRGFDGRSFEFVGKVGGVYNFLSEQNHQLNVRLKFAQMWDHNGTYMEAFSFIYRSRVVIVQLEGDEATVSIDGNPLTLGPQQDEAEEFLGFATGELHVHVQRHRPKYGFAVKVVTELLDLLMYVTPAGTRDEGGVVQPAYMNFDLGLLEMPANSRMGGVLGHTFVDSTVDEDDFQFHHEAHEYELASLKALGPGGSLHVAGETTAAV